jgi:hypothetical protein
MEEINLGHDGEDRDQITVIFFKTSRHVLINLACCLRLETMVVYLFMLIDMICNPIIQALFHESYELSYFSIHVSLFKDHRSGRVTYLVENPYITKNTP